MIDVRSQVQNALNRIQEALREAASYKKAAREIQSRSRVVALTGAEQCAKNLTLDVEANVVLMQDRGLGEPFDGIIEYWWHDAAHFEDMYNSEERKALMREMQDYQSRFADLAASTSFFTESRETC